MAQNLAKHPLEESACGATAVAVATNGSSVGKKSRRFVQNAKVHDGTNHIATLRARPLDKCYNIKGLVSAEDQIRTGTALRPGRCRRPVSAGFTTSAQIGWWRRGESNPTTGRLMRPTVVPNRPHCVGWWRAVQAGQAQTARHQILCWHFRTPQHVIRPSLLEAELRASGGSACNDNCADHPRGVRENARFVVGDSPRRTRRPLVKYLRLGNEALLNLWIPKGSEAAQKQGESGGPGGCLCQASA